MNTRSRKLVALAKINKVNQVVCYAENNLIFIPKYESTEGTTKEEQIAAIDGKYDFKITNLKFNTSFCNTWY